MVAPYLATKGGPHASQDYFIGKYDEFMASDAQRRMPVAALESNNIYPKGGLVLEMLRHYLGDERFWAGTHRYLADHADGLGTTDDFRQAMLAATGENLDWFFDQWLYQAGYPEFKIVSSFDSAAHRLTLLVQQVQADSSPADSTGLRFTTPSAFRMPVTIVAGTTGGRRAQARLDRPPHAHRHLRLAPRRRHHGDLRRRERACSRRSPSTQPTRWLAVQLERDPDLWNRALGDQAADEAHHGHARRRPRSRRRRRAPTTISRGSRPRARSAASPAPRALAPLVAALGDTSARVRAVVIDSLGRLGGDSVLALARTTFDKDPSYARPRRGLRRHRPDAAAR